MKKITKLSLVLTTLLSLSGCGDNAYNGKTGLIGGDASSIDVSSNSSVEHSVNAIYSMIKEDSANAYINSLEMVQSINTLTITKSEANLLKAQEQFKKMALSYKRVEAIYVASVQDPNMKDIADFKIEQFIKQPKSYDVVGDLDKVFAGTKSIVANSLKGLTALEYTLFGTTETLSVLESKMSDNRLAAALLMSNNIAKQFKSIDDYYKGDTTFLADSDNAISITLNVLVQETFNLREWRIGEAGGFTAKYDDTSITRLDYHKSLNSLESIKEILNTQKNIMNSGLKTIASLGNSTSEADAILTAIEDALTICNRYENPLEKDLKLTDFRELYDTVRVLQTNYTALINGLNFRQALLDADGD